MQIYYSNGDGFFNIQRMDEWSVQSLMKGDNVSLIPGDFDGNGITDVIKIDKDDSSSGLPKNYSICFTRP